MTFIDLPSLACGRYEGGENPYSIAAALCGISGHLLYFNKDVVLKKYI